MRNFLKKYSIFFLVLVLALAVFFRLYQFKTVPPGLHLHEAENGIKAVEIIQTAPDYSWNNLENIFLNLQSFTVEIYGNQPWALRSISAVFGILTVLGLYLLTKALFKKEKIALLASFFLAISFWHVKFSRIAFKEIIYPFLLVWGLWIIWSIVNKIKKKDFHHSLLFLTFVISIIIGILGAENLGGKNIIIIEPFVLIFVAFAFTSLIKKINKWLHKKTEQCPEYEKQILRIKKELIAFLFIFLAGLAVNTYNQYFQIWAPNLHTQKEFSEDHRVLGNYIKYLPKEIKKYIIVNGQVDSILFLTDTKESAKQQEKNIYYINPEDIDSFIEKANKEEQLQIFMLENSPNTRKKLSNNIPGLFTYADQTVLIQQK